LAAATVKDNKNIAKYRRALDDGGEILRLERISAVVPDPDKDLAAKGRRCLLLKPGTIPGGNVMSAGREAGKLD
jgi:tRNA (guanine37-N1)-methyltransferase